MGSQDYQALVGSEVYSSDGSNVGSVESIVSDDGGTPFLQVHHNGLFGIGAESFLVPTDAVTSTEDGKVTVNKICRGSGRHPGARWARAGRTGLLFLAVHLVVARRRELARSFVERGTPCWTHKTVRRWDGKCSGPNGVFLCKETEIFVRFE